MNNLQQPIVNWQVVKGDTKAGFAEQRVLIIGQGAGNADAKKLYEDVQETELATLFGDSLVSLAYERFKDFNRANEIDIIKLAEPRGGKAEGGISIDGTVEESCNLKFRIGDDVFDYEVALAKGDTAEVVVDKIVEAVKGKYWLFTATDDTDTAKITHNVAGEVGNKLNIVVENRVKGIDVTTQPFSGGSGAYDSDGILGQLNKRYQTIIFDESMNYDDVEEYLESMFNVRNAVMGGVGITAKNGDYSTLKDFTKGKNSKIMVVFGNLDEYKYCALPILMAIEFGAKRALRMTDGAVLGDLVLDAQEVYGGIEKASLPYHNTPISYKPPIGKLILEQTEDLNDAGISLFVSNGYEVMTGAIVTTYKRDNSGQEDITFKYLNYVDTSLAIQEYLFVNTKKRFAQTRATKGSLVKGRSIVNELSVKGYIVSLYADLVGYTLAQGGKDAIKYFKTNLDVVLDATTGVFGVFSKIPIVGQFRGLNGVIAINFDFKE